jgi:large subunit ribosomal protein L11
MAEKIKSLVDGGKASAGPPLGPALGPLGVNIGDIINAINEKTKEFAGMQVPVTVIVDPATKEFEIEVGSPPVSALIKKELNLEKASGNPKSEMVADMKIEQVIKIAKMKESSMTATTPKAGVKTVVGTCVSMGVMVEGKDPREALNDIDDGMFDEKIASGKTELTEEELKQQEEDRKALEEKMKEQRAEEEKTGNEILEKMKGKTRAEIKHAMEEADISSTTINKLLPVEGEAKEGEEGAAPAEGEKKEEEKAEE